MQSSRSRTFLRPADFQLSDWKPLLIILTSISCIVLYMFVNKSGGYRLLTHLPTFGLSGDLPAYAVRFASSLLFFGIIPLAIALLLGFRPSQIGLRVDGSFLRHPIFWIFLVVFPSISIFSALNTDIATFYPFSKSLIYLYPSHKWILPLHGVLYLLLYYLPWEILFRGILVFPFLPKSFFETSGTMGAVSASVSPALLTIASWQIIPTVMVHLPNPISETLGAIPFGLACAYMVVKFRSVVPGLIIHALCGISVDFTIILRHAV